MVKYRKSLVLVADNAGQNTSVINHQRSGNSCGGFIILTKGAANQMKKEQAYTTQFYFKTKIPYAVIPKTYLQDKSLTLKAKGLLSII